MQDLKVIGVENGALLAASDDGERFRIAIDDVLQSRLRLGRIEHGRRPKVTPREIQQQIRAGLSAEDVAELTGSTLDYVERFEGPILAEREHVVAQALAVPVRTGVEVDLLGEAPTFGSVIRERLAALDASGERWASWKDVDGGWVVKLEFIADSIEHDARWDYEPRKSALAPANAEAAALSQQGELQQSGLIPRLRAVVPLIPDDSRFDSGAFEYITSPASPGPATDQGKVGSGAAANLDRANPDRADAVSPVDAGGPSRTAGAIQAASSAHTTGPVRPLGAPVAAAVNRAADEPKDVQHTADLLEALRRRRGERQAALFDIEALGGVDEAAPVAVVDSVAPDAARTEAAFVTPLPVPAGGFVGDTAGNQTGPLGSRGSSRRGRASMPSWDEIVFGAKGDDDLA